MAPPFETARALSDLYAFQCSQWVPIQNSQLMRKYKEIPVYIRIQIPKTDGPPPLETARALSDLYTFQCSQWVPIRYSQIIGRYKEIPVQRKHVDTKGSQLIRKYKEIPVYIRIQIPKADGPPPFETAWRESDSHAFSYCQWEPIRNSQLIRKYKEILVYIRIQIPKADGPPIWNCLTRKWQPCIFILSMRTHSKQSTY